MKKSRPKLFFASHNAGKIAEVSQLFAATSIEIVACTHGEPVCETGATFVENALIKARAGAKASGLPTLADDSGLMIDALGGAPGVYTARYAGTDCSPAQHMAKVLEHMKAVPVGQRAASFYCVLVLIRTPDDPVPLICSAQWRGQVLKAPIGKQGFGYDPIFGVPGTSLSAAELEPTVKRRICHRGQAMDKLLKKLNASSIFNLETPTS